MDTENNITEQKAAAAFNEQALVFDAIYSDDLIVQYKRERVRQHLNTLLKTPSSILELNAGTGEDALYFAAKGHRIHATDISENMQHALAKKIEKLDQKNNITYEMCSFNTLENLQNKGPYDMVFSNFGGLNCTSNLHHVLQSATPLIKTGGYLTLVIMPAFCLWEFLLVLKGNFKTALRRFAGKKGAVAHIEGKYFRCWYYNPRLIKKQLRSEFNVIRHEGLCVIVPPSYLQNFATSYPRIFRFLQYAEQKLKSIWPWRSIGDYYILTLQKK